MEAFLSTSSNSKPTTGISVIYVDCSQPAVFLYFFIVQSSGRLARELDTSAKQQTWQAIVLSAVLASLAFSPVR